MKKKIKKIISNFIPTGTIKNIIKNYYYNIFAPNYIKYDYDSNTHIYITTFNNIVIKTTNPLYNIVDDFNYYLNFYKLKKNDIVIDAGANVGCLSLYFSKLVGENGKIYAFEPDTFNIDEFKSNLQLNVLSQNIIILDLLLWNENIMVDFNESGTVGSSANWIPENAIIVKKQAIRIDDWVKNNDINKLDFIKMDIEGAEIEALDGCVQTILKLKPNFAIASYHIIDGEPTYIKVEAFFKKIGYPYKTIRFNKSEIITFAGKTL